MIYHLLRQKGNRMMFKDQTRNVFNSAPALNHPILFESLQRLKHMDFDKSLTILFCFLVKNQQMAWKQSVQVVCDYRSTVPISQPKTNICLFSVNMRNKMNLYNE